jgi:uroporphyrinogen decarboxylase
MTTMTPRQRVLAAISHQEPDRVPLDIGGGNSTTLLIETYENLKSYLRVAAPTAVMSETERTAELDEDTMVRLDSDVRPIRTKAPMNWQPPPSEPGTLTDLFGVIWRYTEYEYGQYWEPVGHPLANATMSDLDSFPWPDPKDPGLFAGLAEEVRDLHENTDYAIMGDSVIKEFWEPYMLLRGIEQALVDLLKNQEFFHAVMERLMEINMGIARRFLEITGPYLTVFRTSDDLATQRGPLMSPKTYRQMIQPYHKRFNDFVRQYTDAKIFLHSCGNIVPLLDDLIDAGYEILNPVQVSAFADPAGVKAEYGDRLSFWGAIDTQRVLPQGSVEDVKEEVRLRIRQFGPGGGFVAAAVHNMQPDIPPANILAMSQAVRDLGWYPIR